MGIIFSVVDLDYRDQLKEPEEADHGLHCPELITNHVDSTECQQSGLCNGKDATSQDKEDKWLYVLGHDKLKKRASLLLIEIYYQC